MRRNPHRYTTKITVRSARGSIASIFQDGVHVEDVGPVIGDYSKHNSKANDRAALSAARDRIFDYKVLDYGREGGKGLYPGRAPRRNSGKTMTKAQKRAKAKTAATKRRVASALAKYLKVANPGRKLAGARVEKLAGGVLKITPIKVNRGRR